MRITIIVLALTLFTGCAIVPIASYDAYGPYYSSTYYAPPVHDAYYGYGYHRPLYNGYYMGRGFGYRGRYGYYR